MTARTKPTLIRNSRTLIVVPPELIVGTAHGNASDTFLTFASADDPIRT